MKRSYLLAAVAAGSLALGLGGLVWAQPAPQGPGHGPGRMMAPHMGMMGPGRGAGAFGLLAFDANADGKLTRAEFDAAQHARFNDLDANKDGFVTPDEMKARGEKLRADAEAARFQMLDTDHNGQLSKAEFDAAAKNHPGARMGPAGAHGGPGMMRAREGFRHGRHGAPGADGKPHDASAPRRAGPLDANADGKISFEEFSGRAGDAFARADLNKDNIVTIAELQTLTKAPR